MTTATARKASGTGSLTYRVGNQSQSTAQCAFQSTETSSGVLTLEITPAGGTDGGFTIAIEVADYSPSQSLYGMSQLTLRVKSETRQGYWISGSGSSGSLFIRNVSTDANAVYVGSLSVSSLAWLGAGGPSSIAICRGRFFLSAGAAGALTAEVISAGGDGWATITYQTGTDSGQTVYATVGLYIYQDESITLVSEWTDNAGNDLSLFAAFQSQGTGIYDSAQVFIQVAVTVMNLSAQWSNQNYQQLAPGIVINLISTPVSTNSVWLQAGLSIQQLPWVHTASVPDKPALSVWMSAFGASPANLPG